MASFLGAFSRWFGALTERRGEQVAVPGAALVNDVTPRGTDSALQVSTVWACIDLRAATVASLPFFAYNQAADGQKQLARQSRLYTLLHDSPNARMTPFEFWRAMVMNHDLRGNAYARIERDTRTGEAIALWPMPADQVAAHVMQDGSMVYVYTLDNDVAVLAEESVLHLKNLGNGTVGLSKLEFMNATTDEVAKAQESAQRMFGNGGKPTGLLMVDHVLKPDQRQALRERFAEMAYGNTSRLYVLEANMKYQQLSLSPEQQQLLDTRRYGVEELCRWLGVPPVLVHHSNVTTWGSGIDQIKDGFYTLAMRPMLTNIEQAVRKRVMTARQRATMTVEFNFDALLRANSKDRSELYAKLVQNGLMTRNEGRQFENLPRVNSAIADQLTVQTNLVPIDKLGTTQPTGGLNAPAQDPIAQ